MVTIRATHKNNNCFLSVRKVGDPKNRRIKWGSGWPERMLSITTFIGRGLASSKATAHSPIKIRTMSLNLYRETYRKSLLSM